MKDNILKDTTCFNEHAKRSLSCQKSSCRCWFKDQDNLNCVLLASKNGPRTLQEIGDHFGITRMRVCQIEKSITQKIRKEVEKD